MQLLEAMNRVLALVEERLEGEADMSELAREVGYSDFYLQRTFAMMAGEPLGTYIRERRLTRAGQLLQSEGVRVLDTALRFGWESPESFEKAFKRFHGVTAAQAKRGAPLRCVDPLRIRVEMIGGKFMDYQVEEVKELFIMGMERRFDYENSFAQIPGFWDEYYAKGYNRQVPGFVGLCLDDEGGMRKDFAYVIGAFCGADEQPPHGFVKRTLAAAKWVKFKTHGALPDALQKLNRQVYTQWLPTTPDWTPAYGANLEVYSEGDMSSPDYECELWLPVKAKG